MNEKVEWFSEEQISQTPFPSVEKKVSPVSNSFDSTNSCITTITVTSSNIDLYHLKCAQKKNNSFFNKVYGGS